MPFEILSLSVVRLILPNFVYVQDYLYWSDTESVWKQDKTQSMPGVNNGLTKLISAHVVDVRVYHALRQPKGKYCGCSPGD